MKNYFKKFSIMFVMALAIIGFGMIYSGSSANAATVGQQLTSPESGWRRYDETDSKIKYIGTWQTDTTANVSSSFMSSYNNATRSYTCQVGGSLSFKFYGTKLRIIGDLYNSTYRVLTAQITIDGIDYTISLPSTTSSIATFKCLEYEITGLSLGYHTISYKKIDSNTGKALLIDAIDIDSNGQLLPFDKYLTLDKSTMNLTQDDSGQLTATTTPAGAQVTWTSSDSTIATVDSTGKVTGMKEGQATITAKTTDGLIATCVVTVTNNTVPVEPQPTDTEYITNIAHAKGTNTNNPGGEVTIIFHGSADAILSVVKTTDVKDVWIGDNFTYTIVVTNTGTKTAKAVVVNDPAPNHIDFNVNGVTTTQGSVDSSSTSKNIIVNVGDILPGGTVTIKVPATVIA